MQPLFRTGTMKRTEQTFISWCNNVRPFAFYKFGTLLTGGGGTRLGTTFQFWIRARRYCERIVVKVYCINFTVALAILYNVVQ